MTNDTADRFAAIAQGIECPLDAPRPETNEHWDFIAPLSVSSLYLATNQTYRGRSQLIFDRRHAARPEELTRDEWLAFAADLFAAHNAIMRVVRADHVNIESLGNIVPHLHWHIIPRCRTDPRWGLPVWLTSLDDMQDHRLERSDRDALIAAIRAALGTSTAT
jgi:diadenosine tetraphosphate (Ap4A) HIT family hydrolase